MTQLFEALRLASTIEQAIPGGTIFGGFWRDVLLGVPYRDIDIAVNDFTPTEGFVLNENDHGDYEHTFIDAVFTNGPLNVIVFNRAIEPEAMNDYCDIGICKVAWSHSRGLILSPEFIKDVSNMTLTVYRRGWGRSGVLDHLERLRQKFPHHEVIDQ